MWKQSQLSVAGKIMAKILLKRLVRHVSRTKTKSSWFLELQYADVCALVSHTREGLQ